MDNLVFLLVDYLLDALGNTAKQLCLLFGPLIILGLAIHYVSGFVGAISHDVLGRQAHFMLLGWLGALVHEAGHALFALLFGHKVRQFRLYRKDQSGNLASYIQHDYNPTNVFQSIGCFFVSVGPILLGAMLLFVVTYFVFGVDIGSFHNVAISPGTFTDPYSFGRFCGAVFHGWLAYSGFVLSGANAPVGAIALYLYLLYAIGGAISLSSADLRVAVAGLWHIAGLCFALNVALLWAGDIMGQGVAWIIPYCSGFYFVAITALLVNLVFLLVLFIFVAVVRLLRRL